MENATTAFGPITEALGNSMGSVKDGMLEAISTVMPYALVVGGAVLVITLGWKIFKRLSK